MIVSPTIVLVEPTGDLQGAIDDATPGTIIRLSAGIFTPTTTTGFTIDKPLTIEGLGCGTTDGATNFVTESYGSVIAPLANGNGFVVDADDVTIRNLLIARPTAPGAVGTGDGIKVVVAGTNQTRLTIEDVICWNMGRDGLHVEAGAGLSLNLLNVNRCQFKQCGRDGVHLESAAFPHLEHVWCAANRLHGAYLYSCGLARVRSCSFETNQVDGTTTLQHAQVQCVLSHAATFDGCSFETYYNRTVPVGLTFSNCYGCRAEGNYFGNPAVDGISAGVPSLAQLQATLGIVLIGQTQGCFIGANVYDYVNTYLYIHDAALETPPVTNVGNFILQQVTHNTEAGIDGYSYIPEDTPTFALFPEGFGDTATLGAPQDTPGGFLFPPTAEPPAAIGRRGGVLYDDSVEQLKLYRDGRWQEIASGLVVYDGDIVTYDDDPVSY